MSCRITNKIDNCFDSPYNKKVGGVYNNNRIMRPFSSDYSSEQPTKDVQSMPKVTLSAPTPQDTQSIADGGDILSMGSVNRMSTGDPIQSEMDSEEEDYLSSANSDSAGMYQVVFDGTRYINVDSLSKRLYEVTEKRVNNTKEYKVKRYSDGQMLEIENKAPGPLGISSSTPYFKEDYNTYVSIKDREYRYGKDDLDNEYIITCRDDPTNDSYSATCKNFLQKGLKSGKDDNYCKNPKFYKTGKTGKEDEIPSEQEGYGLLPKIFMALAPFLILIIGFLVTNKESLPGGFKNLISFFKNGATTTLVTTGFIGLAILVTVMLVMSANKKDAWCHDPYHKNSIKSTRSQSRGLHISMVLALSAGIQALLKALGADESTLLLLYGFILASVFGFMGDKMIGTDEGYSLWTNNKMSSFKYALGSLTGSSFFRYIITVFLDMFISMPIQMVLASLMSGYISSLVGNTTGINVLDSGILSGLTRFVGNNFDNVLQSIVGIITFMAYTNETRFLWAYPDKSLLPEERIPVPTIKLAASIAAALYLVTNYPNDVAGAGLGERFVYVMIVIMLLTLGSIGVFNIEPESTYKVKKSVKYNFNKGEYEIITDLQNVSNELESKNDVKNKWLKGGALFTGLLFVGVGIPMILGKIKKK